MLTSLKTFLLNRDQFGTATNLKFKSKDQYSTIPGGVYSLMLSLFIGALWYQQFYLMFSYGNNSINEISTKSKFNELGNVTLE